MILPLLSTHLCFGALQNENVERAALEKGGLNDLLQRPRG